MTDQDVARARRAAHGVLVRVARDAAYADRALDAAISRASLSQRDRALATELTYGTLRSQIYLDFLLGKLAKQPLRKMPIPVLASLRMGAYQILETRIPARAAVHDAVAIVRETHPHAAGFVNAVLRRLAALFEAGGLPEPSAELAQPLEALAVRGSHPLWLVREVAGVIGQERVRAWIAANNERPPLSLRVNRSRATREKVAAELIAAGLTVEAPERFPDGLWVKGAGSVAELAPFVSGEVSVQDLGAQLVARLLAPAPGSMVLDACAAPGGKAAHLAEMMGNNGLVLATDVHAGRTRLIASQAERLGLTAVKTAAVDATSSQAITEILSRHGRTAVDAALVDAPCSGLGTLRRNPELRALSSDALRPLTELQDALLEAIVPLVAPGGVLVYAVCTVTAAEGPERIRALLERHPELRAERLSDPVLLPFYERQGELEFLRTWTDEHRVDSFFAARLVRRGS